MSSASVIYRVTLLLALLPHVLAFPWTKHDPEVKMTVPEIINHWGYPVEIHHVITQDGFILELHRIPHGRSGPTNASRPVVFLQHGLESSSSNWVTNLPHQSAGFVFADAGFDVWLGNMRGNTYSRRHLDLKPNSNKFWEHTWDEMAQYDLPAMIYHALLVSGQPHVYYVGHSQGTLTMFSKLSSDQEFANKIKMFFALAPVGSVRHIRGLLKKLVDDLSSEFTAWTKVFGMQQFLPNNWLTKSVTSGFCGNNALQEELCKHVLFAMCGPDPKGLNKTRLPVYYSHTPAGTSSMNILHWIQMVKRGSVAKFDYGEKENLVKYGQKQPPVYNFGDITGLPIYLYIGGNDWLADNEDIKGYLSPRIKATVQQKTFLPDYNHLDFIWGIHAAEDVYQPIANLIKQDLGNFTTEG
ncbi:hypothetical protein Q1695_002024 [Nippostrongylus brasiliensis]|nr:hypothetical protein Q1695_002024 [Nippostrongylus brasiliensis]